MLEKPDINDAKIIACLRDSYGLNIAQVEFLPLGADPNTAVYRVVADATHYFLKLRSGEFAEASVIVPALLHQGGMTQVIAPITTQTGQLWGQLDNFAVILYPFVEGQNGYEIALTDQHWIEFGRALKSLHTVTLPSPVTDRIQRENYSDHWRETVKDFLVQVEATVYSDPVSAQLAALLTTHKPVIDHLVNRAEQLVALLQTDSPPFVACHADIHAGNFLITPDGTLYIVDWDTLLLAPKERDLMFVGGALQGGGRTPQEEERLFYQGYGQTEIDSIALAYYRYERIVQDIAAYCTAIFLADPSSADRAVGLRQLSFQFQPNQVIDIACQTEKLLPPDLQSSFTFNPGL
jgi:spectinomycin phosphotransferase